MFLYLCIQRPAQYKEMAKYCSMWRNWNDISGDSWESGVAPIIDYWGGDFHEDDDYDQFVNAAGPGT